ncbi:alpha/beta hydrolase [Orbus sturtevantii]
MRQEQQKIFTSYDGTTIFYRHWPVAQLDQTKKAIILFHRGHEHSGRIAHLVDELELDDFEFFAWDARGNGQSGGERGDAQSFATLVRDAHDFIKHIKKTIAYKIKILQLLGKVSVLLSHRLLSMIMCLKFVL